MLIITTFSTEGESYTSGNYLTSNFGEDFRKKFLPILLALQRDSYETAQARDEQIYNRINSLTAKVASQAASLVDRVTDLEKQEVKDVGQLSYEIKENDKLEVFLATFALASSAVIGLALLLQKCLKNGFCKREQYSEGRERDNRL